MHHVIFRNRGALGAVLVRVEDPDFQLLHRGINMVFHHRNRAVGVVHGVGEKLGIGCVGVLRTLVQALTLVDGGRIRAGNELGQRGRIVGEQIRHIRALLGDIRANILDLPRGVEELQRIFIITLEARERNLVGGIIIAVGHHITAVDRALGHVRRIGDRDLHLGIRPGLHRHLRGVNCHLRIGPVVGGETIVRSAGGAHVSIRREGVGDGRCRGVVHGERRRFLHVRIAQRNLRGRDRGGSTPAIRARLRDRSEGRGQIDQAGTLAVRGELRGIRAAVHGHRVGGILQGRAHLRRREIRVGLEQQGRAPGHVRGRHRGTRNRLPRGRHGIINRPRGINIAARGNHVRLELQVRSQAPGGEIGNFPAGGRGGYSLGVGPFQAGVSGGRGLFETFALFLGDRDDRDRYGRVSGDGCVDGAGLVVVDDDRCGAVVLRGTGLLVEGRGSARDKHCFPGKRCSGKINGTGFLPFGIGDDVEPTRRGHRRRFRDSLKSLRSAVEHNNRAQHVGIIHGAYRDNRGAHRRSTAGENALRTGVTLGSRYHHTGGNEVFRGHRGGVVRPGREGRTNGHIDNVHLVPLGAFERGENDFGAGGTRASENAVSTDHSIGSHALERAFRVITRGDAGHVRAVPAAGPAVIRKSIRVGDRLEIRVAAIRIEGIAHEIVAGHDLVIGESTLALDAVPAESRVINGHAGINDSHAHALAGEAEFLIGHARAGHIPRGVHIGGFPGAVHFRIRFDFGGPFHREHRVNTDHISVIDVACQFHRIGFDGHAVPHVLVGGVHLATVIFDRLGEFPLFARDTGGGATSDKRFAFEFNKPFAGEIRIAFRRGNGGADIEGFVPI